MARLVSIDGVPSAPEEARVSVFDRGFLYGDSVFETIRTYAGEPFALAEHLARLGRSASLVDIAMPVPPAKLATEVRLAVRAARNDESYIRVMITRGSGPLGLDPGLARAPLRVIFVEPFTPLPVALYRDGADVLTRTLDRACDAAPGAKVGNYLASLLALRDAKARGAHEALIVDARGHVVEGTTSNVFLVRHGALVTPPADAGILLGITRRLVLELASESRVRAVEAPVDRGALATAEEVFVCSTLREVVPVVRVDGRLVGDGRPGPVTRRLHAAFRGFVGLGAAPMPWETPRESRGD